MRVSFGDDVGGGAAGEEGEVEEAEGGKGVRDVGKGVLGKAGGGLVGRLRGRHRAGLLLAGSESEQCMESERPLVRDVDDSNVVSLAS